MTGAHPEGVGPVPRAGREQCLFHYPVPCKLFCNGAVVDDNAAIGSCLSPDEAELAPAEGGNVGHELVLYKEPGAVIDHGELLDKAQLVDKIDVGLFGQAE